MNDPIGEFYRIRRIVCFTVVGLMVWPVALVMALLYPEERKYWLRILGINVAIAVIVFAYLGIKGMLG